MCSGLGRTRGLNQSALQWKWFTSDFAHPFKLKLFLFSEDSRPLWAPFEKGSLHNLGRSLQVGVLLEPQNRITELLSHCSAA